MKVKILNPEQATKLLHYWGMFAAVCYNTQTNTPEKNRQTLPQKRALQRIPLAVHNLQN